MRSVTLSCDDVTCTVTDDGGDLTIYTYATLIKQCLVGIGFHPENVDDLFFDAERWTKQAEDEPYKHCTCRADDETLCFYCRLGASK